MNGNDSVQNTGMQDAIPTEQEIQQDIETVIDDVTAPDEHQHIEEESVREEDGGTVQPSESEVICATDNEPFLSVRYNHKDCQLTRKEAIDYAQIGMRHKSMQEKLDCAAALSGVDIDTLIDAFIRTPEESHRKHLVELYGEGSEDVEIGMDIFRQKQTEDYKKLVAQRDAQANTADAVREDVMQRRLADEYIELKSEIPEVPDFANLPPSVVREAASGKRDLLSAYLRYQMTESKKIDAADKSEAAAAAASAGSKAGTYADNMSSFDKALLNGLWGR